MKKSFLTISLFLLGCLHMTAQQLTLDAWMAQIPDETPFSTLSIPATHDAGALLGGDRLTCQLLPISAQLYEGIRGFDVRLDVLQNNKLGIFHSTQNMGTTWEDDVWPVLTTFLKSHPSETIFLSLKKENGSTGSERFTEVLSQYLNAPENQPFIVQNLRQDITLGECRGKMVIMHRDEYLDEYPGAQCHGFEDNASFSMVMRTQNGEKISTMVEDEYGYEDDTHGPYKLKTTYRNIRRAMKQAKKSGNWFITFASATSSEFVPREFANAVNANLARKLEGKKASCGIILMDFAGTYDGTKLTRAIIATNQPPLVPPSGGMYNPK